MKDDPDPCPYCGGKHYSKQNEVRCRMLGLRSREKKFVISNLKRLPKVQIMRADDYDDSNVVGNASERFFIDDETGLLMVEVTWTELSMR